MTWQSGMDAFSHDLSLYNKCGSLLPLPSFSFLIRALTSSSFEKKENQFFFRFFIQSTVHQLVVVFEKTLDFNIDFFVLEDDFDPL